MSLLNSPQHLDADARNAVAREHALQPWPIVTVQEWRYLAEDLVAIAYDLAVAAMLAGQSMWSPPRDAPFPKPPPSQQTVDKVMQGLKWFHTPEDSKHAYPRSMRLKFTLSKYVGQYSPKLEEKILGPQKPDCKGGRIVRRQVKRSRQEKLGVRRTDSLAAQLNRMKL